MSAKFIFFRLDESDREKKYLELQKELGYSDDELRGLAESIQLKVIDAVTGTEKDKKLAFLLRERERKDTQSKRNFKNVLGSCKKELSPQAYQFFSSDIDNIFDFNPKIYTGVSEGSHYFDRYSWGKLLEFLYDIRNVYGNNPEQFIVFLEILANPAGLEKCRQVLQYRHLFCDDIEKLKICRDLAKFDHASLDNFIDNRALYGNDPEKMKLIRDLYIEHEWELLEELPKSGQLISGEAGRLKLVIDLIKPIISKLDRLGGSRGNGKNGMEIIYEFCGEDLEMLKMASVIFNEYGIEALKKMAKIKAVFAGQPARYQIVLDFVSRKGDSDSTSEKLDAICGRSNFYGKDFGLLQLLLQFPLGSWYLFSKYQNVCGKDPAKYQFVIDRENITANWQLDKLKILWGADFEKFKFIVDALEKGETFDFLEWYVLPFKDLATDLESLKNVFRSLREAKKHHAFSQIDKRNLAAAVNGNMGIFKDYVEIAKTPPSSDRAVILVSKFKDLYGSDHQKFQEVLGVIKPCFNIGDILLDDQDGMEPILMVAADDSNWIQLAISFISTTADDPDLPAISRFSREKLQMLFDMPETKNFCLERLQTLWRDSLAKKQSDDYSAKLGIISTFVNLYGAGPMSQFEALVKFADIFRKKIEQPSVTEADDFQNTKNQLEDGVFKMEGRFDKERWSNEDRTDFYNISRDILAAEPGLFVDFLKTFKALSPAALKVFMAEIYPLYRAQLATMEKQEQSETEEINGTSSPKHNSQELIKLSQSIRNFAKSKKDPEAFKKLKEELIDDLKEKFKLRFGIKKIPEKFTAEHIWSLTNLMLYLANMSNRTGQKEKILGWYLALILNGKWDAFRSGEKIDPAEYLVPQNASILAEVCSRHQKLLPVTAERVKVEETHLPEFQALLQREEAVMGLGDIETIDIKLSNIIANLQLLKDPDLYPEKLDKHLLKLMLDFGNKKLNAVTAKMFLQLNGSKKTPVFSAEEIGIMERIKAILMENNLPLTTDSIKTHFQDGLKALSLVVNVLSLVEEIGVEEEINVLRKMLVPSAEIVAIFGRLGEDFKPTSGALALTQDLDFLDKLIVRRESDLKPEEKLLLTGYISKIREQLAKLQTIHEQVKARFGKVKIDVSGSGNNLLREKLNEVDKIINAQDGQQTVTTTITGDLNPIIENIRECLSCTKQGSNNDTDLTFGEGNKFFVYSHAANQQKSIADQIVLLEPITCDGKQNLAFVFDRLYGACTPFVLINHIKAVRKKMEILKKQFPENNINIFITASAITTAGITKELLAEKLQKELGSVAVLESKEIEVDVLESALGENYIEFGGVARGHGKRTVDGLLLS